MFLFSSSCFPMPPLFAMPLQVGKVEIIELGLPRFAVEELSKRLLMLAALTVNNAQLSIMSNIVKLLLDDAWHTNNVRSITVSINIYDVLHFSLNLKNL